MPPISTNLRQRVIQRAAGRCEYCQLSQDGQEAMFHLDHVIPQAAGGATVSDNLELACVFCSLRKAACRTAIDPESGQEAPLYHPRQQVWSKHFRWDGVSLRGLTPMGRATIDALRMNRALIVAMRTEEAARGRHPLPEMSET